MDTPALTRILSTAALALFAAGLLFRFRSRVHVPAMVVAGLTDLVVLVMIEIHARSSSGRGAVEEGVEHLVTGSSLLPQAHVAVSTLALLAYLVALASGLRLLLRGGGRRLHRGNAVAFGALRLASYVTSFWM